MSYFVDMRDAERQYNQRTRQRDELREEVRHLNRMLAVYGEALVGIAEETETPYGRTAQRALDDAAALDRTWRNPTSSKERR